MGTSQFILPKTTIYNVEYNIPRVMVGFPGRQDRHGDGRLRITPGMAEPFEFIWGDLHGVPLAIGSFDARLVFWLTGQLDTEAKPELRSTYMGQSEIVLSKKWEPQDPQGGRGTIQLSGDETEKLGLISNPHDLRWGLFLESKTDGEIYPMQVAQGGARYGSVIMDMMAGFPSKELMRGTRDS